MKNNLQILKAMCHEKPLSSYATMFGYKEEDGRATFSKKVDFTRFGDEPTIANEFMGDFYNKIVNQYTVNLFEQSPLMTHFGRFAKTMSKIGDIEERIATKLQSVINYDTDTAPTNPFEVNKPQIVLSFISTTDKDITFVTLNYEQWYGAFVKENGLSSLAGQILSDLNTAIENDIYYKILADISDTNKLVSKEVTKINDTSEATVKESTLKFYREVLELRTKMNLPSKTGEFNKSALENNGTPYGKMVLYLNVKYATSTMVSVLASLFNSSKIELKWDVVEFPSTATGVIGVLMDERAYVFGTRIKFTQSIMNPRNMYINTYNHAWYKRGVVPFYNAVILKEKATA